MIAATLRATSLFCIALGVTWAQVSTGTIVGVVKDSSGGAIANAAVKLTHTTTGEVRQTATNEHGEFSAPFVPLGNYSVTVEAPGFQTKTLTGIILLVDQTANLNITLEVGTINQSVEVVSTTPLVDSVTSISRPGNWKQADS
ncbi:MAG TPA: carboxypeptidase-like regulatory domain-containing protein [Terriglobia bacterium]|nr:carboxypeptidase-like regulatory domain-containing protein [Terriglobia bacterium]